MPVVSPPVAWWPARYARPARVARCVVRLPAFGVRRHRITLADRPRMRELIPHATVKLVGPTHDQWSEWPERSGQAGWATLSLLSILAVILLGLALVSHRAIG